MDIKKLKDRGLVKWNPAAFMVEQKDLMKEMYRDYYSQPKPILDEYQIQEFESKIHYAMGYNLVLEITVWNDGFEDVYEGRCHYLDHIDRKIKLAGKDGLVVIQFENIVGISVKED